MWIRVEWCCRAVISSRDELIHDFIVILATKKNSYPGHDKPSCSVYWLSASIYGSAKINKIYLSDSSGGLITRWRSTHNWAALTERREKYQVSWALISPSTRHSDLCLCASIEALAVGASQQSIKTGNCDFPQRKHGKMFWDSQSPADVHRLDENRSGWPKNIKDEKTLNKLANRM